MMAYVFFVCFSEMAEIRTKKALAVIVVLNILRKKKWSPRQRKHKTREWMQKRVKKGLFANIIFGTFSGGSPRILWNYANESWPISRDSGQNWALNCYWSCNTTLLKGRPHASTFVVCWRKCLIEIKTFFQQKMLNKRHQTCMLHVLTLLIQRMFYNKFERVAGV